MPATPPPRAGSPAAGAPEATGGPRAAWRPGRRSFAALAATLFVAAALGAAWWYLRVHEPDDGRYVALYVTDLPGGFEKLTFVIASATVGPAGHPLTVVRPQVEISSLHGPEDHLRVAEGRVPRGAGTQVSLFFAAAQGLRAGQWIDLAMPENRLTLPRGLVDDATQSTSVLFDFNLDTSVVERDGSAEFRPFVQNIYYHGTDDGPSRLEDLPDLSSLLRIELPDQVLDRLADEVARRVVESLCDRTSCGPGRLGPSGTLPSTEPRSSLSGGPSGAPDDGQTGRPRPTAGSANAPPLRPESPMPADRAGRQLLQPDLRWAASDPDGDDLTYDVYLDGVAVCRDLQNPTCSPAVLQRGQTYRWWVEARDPAGSVVRGPEWVFSTMRAPVLSMPTPADGSEHILLGTEVRWDASHPDGDDLIRSYEVFMRDGLDRPEILRCSNLQVKHCDPNANAAHTWYYWRVVAFDDAGRTEGPVWSFRTV